MRPSVLVVEDEPDHRTVARLTLRLGGYDVWEASSGEEALVVLSDRQPHAVVLDMRLPGIDGLSLLAKLRSSEQLATLPVILCSAHATESAPDPGDGDPCTRFVAKPFHPDDLLAALSSVAPAPSSPGTP